MYGVVALPWLTLAICSVFERGVPLGLVFILEFTASIWIVLWIKFVRKRICRSRYVGCNCSLPAGLVLVQRLGMDLPSTLIGIAGSLGSAFALAAYFLMSEKIGKGRQPIAMLIFGMGFASIFWLLFFHLGTFLLKYLQ
jgi:drug/metabolite transporter (DMT)-like permease